MCEVVQRCRGKDVSDFKKGRIIGLHQSKKTTKEVAEITGIGLRSVQRIFKTWKDSGEPPTSRNKCGRKKLLNSRDRRSLKRPVKKNRKKSYLELTAILNMGHKGTSTRTMQREFKGMELNSCGPTRKPLVSAINFKKRLQFAKQHKNWTVEQWGNVTWSYESRFSLFHNDGCTRVRQEPHEAMDPSCIVPTVQTFGGSIMIWNCFNGSNLGSATLCDNKMKSQHYLNVLNDQVIPSLDFFLPNGTGICYDDRSTEH
ncbi:Transposable element Tcb1 transposase [Araneus ventricosus]|uniref:Transposable element Tcb1 transposase n=1 Tax=Araneus ventricosus TaxID=182803 RepID=A0A4Y2B0P3_ARAVE|nr:Transposable element Tcb1 transposase [Araneus ventricosus]